MTSSTIAPVASVLADRVSGPVYLPGNPGYAEEIAGFNTAIVHTPDLVVGAASAADIGEAVRFAREHGYRVSVHSTGHTEAPVTSGLLITTRRLDHLRVDPEIRTATIGAGVRWGAVIAAASKHGLAPITGSSPTVGVVGLLLGGGLGPLARSHGFSSDYLLGLTVVTGRGDVVEASADRHPDLFWALRGGKQGLGVVTEVRLRLVELRTLYAGSLIFDEAHIEPALRAWVSWTAEADPRVTTSVAIIRFPAFDAVPAPLRGRRLLSLRFAFPGAGEVGARLAAPLRAAAPVYLDELGEMPAAEVARIHHDPTEPGPGRVAGMLLTHVDQQFATALLDQVGAGIETPLMLTEIRHLGGATRHDVAEGSSATGRAAGFTFGYGGIDPTTFETTLPVAADRLADALQPWTAPENNVNLMGAPRSAEQFASAWTPDTFAKLAEIRHRYDLDGVFAYGYEPVASR